MPLEISTATVIATTPDAEGDAHIDSRVRLANPSEHLWDEVLLTVRVEDEQGAELLTDTAGPEEIAPGTDVSLGTHTWIHLGDATPTLARFSLHLRRSERVVVPVRLHDGSVRRPLTVLSCQVELGEPEASGEVPVSIHLRLLGDAQVRYDSVEADLHLLDAHGERLATASVDLPELEGEGPHEHPLTARVRVDPEAVAGLRCEVLARAHEEQQHQASVLTGEPPEEPEEPAPSEASEGATEAMSAAERRQRLHRARRASTDAETSHRLEAVATALELGGPDGGEVIHSFVRDPDPEVRRAAFDAAVSLREDGLPAVITAVSAPDPAIATEALEHLSALQDPSAGTRARPLLRHDNPQLRAAAATYLGLVAGPSLRPALSKLLSDPDGEVRAAASRAVATLAGDRPKPAKRGWWEPEPEGEAASLDAAQTKAMPQTTTPAAPAGPEVDLSEVLTRLGSVPAEEREALVARLRSLDPRDVMAQIRRVRASAPEAIARGAALATGRLELDSLISHIRQLLRHPAPSVRTAALDTLGLLAPAGTLPSMSALLRDESPQVVAAAALALARVAARTNRQALVSGYLDRVSSEDERVTEALAEARAMLGS